MIAQEFTRFNPITVNCRLALLEDFGGKGIRPRQAETKQLLLPPDLGHGLEREWAQTRSRKSLLLPLNPQVLQERGDRKLNGHSCLKKHETGTGSS